MLRTEIAGELPRSTYPLFNSSGLRRKLYDGSFENQYFLMNQYHAN